MAMEGLERTDLTATAQAVARAHAITATALSVARLVLTAARQDQAGVPARAVETEGGGGNNGASGTAGTAVGGGGGGAGEGTTLSGGDGAAGQIKITYDAPDPQRAVGKIGQALEFDGVDDYISLGSPASLAIDGPITISAWIKRADTSSDMYVVNSNSRFNFRIETDSTIVFKDNNTNGIVSSAQTFQVGVWYHIAGVFRGNNNDTVTLTNAQLYLNGVSIGNSVSGAWAPVGAGLIGIMQDMCCGSGFDRGTLDDVRIYNRALSPDEIKRLYNMGGTVKLNSSTVSNNSLSKGLVGWWTFDGKDISGVQAYDRSGNGNRGILTSGPTRTIGKVGQALKFYGVNDNIQVTNSSNQVIPSGNAAFTISHWFKAETLDNTVSRMFFYNGAGTSGFRYGIVTPAEGYCGGGTPQIFFWSGEDGGTVDICASPAIKTGIWYHAVTVYTGTSAKVYINAVEEGSDTSGTIVSNTNNIQIGEGDDFGKLDFKGLMDDVRIYNRALTADEIKRLYNLGGTVKLNTSQNLNNNNSLQNGLVGWWTFDGKDISGVQAYDKSGNGNRGILTGGPTRAVGKIGQGLEFDATDDYVSRSINSSSNLWMGTQDWTVSAWVKFANPGGGTEEGILGTWNGQDKYWYIRKEAATGKIFYRLSASSNAADISTATLGNAITDTGWHYIVLAFDRDVTATLYQDGVSTATGSISNVNGKDITNSVDTEFNIGQIGEHLSAFYFKGLLDDVRVYNRVLSVDEIKRLYNMGR